MGTQITSLSHTGVLEKTYLAQESSDVFYEPQIIVTKRYLILNQVIYVPDPCVTPQFPLHIQSQLAVSLSF